MWIIAIGVETKSISRWSVGALQSGQARVAGVIWFAVVVGRAVQW